MTAEKSKLDQLLEARAALATDQPRRHEILTLLAVDVAASAGYFDRMGREPDAGVLEQYERLGTRAVDGYGGRLVRAMGDVMLAEFSEASLAAQAAAHMQTRLSQLRRTLLEEDQVQLRMGVATGTCVRSSGDLYGECVERAVAICKRAGPAQILIGQEVREAVAGLREVNCLWLGAFQIEGGEENLFEVIWTESGEYAQIRQQTTTALRRGDLRLPGMQITELAQPDPLKTSVMGTVAPPPPPIAGGDVIGMRTGEFVPVVPASISKRYEIRGELGRGGMGVVYKAWDRETDEMVALKVLRGEIATDDNALVRFRNEVRTARRVTHKNVCRIHDFNRTDDAAYITMEFIEGRSLRQMITESAGLATEQGLVIARQICSGLAEAHAQGIVHRDLKPENVMIDGEGTVRLLDFGIARSAMGAGVTQTGAVMGTPAYMAPEQAEGIHIDHRVDIYALGLILYEMFTGSPTFRAPTPIAVVMKHIQEQPTSPREFKPAMPRHIEETILRCLVKKPDERFQSVAEVVEALEGRAEAFPPGVPRPSVRPAPSLPTTGEAPTKPMPQAAATTQPLPQTAAAAARPSNKVWIVAGVFALFIMVAFGAALLYFKPWRAFMPGSKSETTASVPAPNDQQPGTPATPGDTGTKAPDAGDAGGAPPSGTAKAEDQPSGGVDLGTPAPGGTAKRPVPETPASGPGTRPAPETTAPRASPPVNLAISMVNSFHQRGGAVNGVALSSNGQLIATAGQDNTVGIWNPGSGQQLQKMRGHTGPVLGVAMSRDGSQVASASADRTARLWSAGAGAEVKLLARESTAVLRAAFSPDGQLLATTLADGRIKLWDTGSGNAVQNLTGHNGSVFSIAFSSDGRLLVSGGQDGTVRIWSVSGVVERVLRGHEGPVSAVAISNDGRQVASGGADGTVRVWEVASGKEIATLKDHAGSVDALAFGPDGRWVVSGGSDKVLRVWDVANSKQVNMLERHIFSITGITVSPGGKSLATSDSGGNVMLWRW